AALCAMIAAMPELAIDIARIGNESLAIPLATLLVLLMLRSLRDARSVALGVTMGFALLAKAYFLAFFPALMVLAAIQIFRAPRLWRRICGGLGVTVAIAIAIAGWWYWRAFRLTGSWTAEQLDAAT